MSHRIALGILALILAGGACRADEPTTSSTGVPTLPSTQVCTLIGCLSGVSYRIADAVSADWPRPLNIEICLDDHCEHVEITEQQMVASHRTRVGLYEDIDLEASHATSIQVVAPDGSILLERSDTVTLSPVQPNGPSCPPTCWQASIDVTSDG